MIVKKTMLALLILLIIVVVFYRKISIGNPAENELENLKESEYVNLDIPIKKFLAEPTGEAKSVYEIPIGVRILGCTKDKKWYKVRISYNFIGYFQYEGWCKVE